MDELYTEILIQKKPKLPFPLAIALIVIVDILLLAGGILLFRPLVILFIIALILEVLFAQRISQEYEYLYVTGSLDIDVIYSKSRRKQIDSITFDYTELIAPVGDPSLARYQNAPLSDYTSGYPGRRDYEIVVHSGSLIRRYRVEVNDVMINDLKRRMPHKVVMENA